MIEIKNTDGKVIFISESAITIKEALEEAVSQNKVLYEANLSDIDLSHIDLHGANLMYADFSYANLFKANLENANLVCSDFFSANLYRANLFKANLCETNLRGASLRKANLVCANLVNTDLRGTNLEDANLGEVNLRNAILYDTYLKNTKNVPYIRMACPSHGVFIGWKKVERYLVKLEIPEDAKRSSATTHKCRCSKAKVLEIINLMTGEHKNYIVNYNRPDKLVYKVGEMVYPDSFDDNRWNECSHGIHFFINKQEAIDYEI